METDTLNTLVTSAIWRAQELEALKLPAAPAWAQVSILEDRLASILPLNSGAGRIARRGAVRSAFKSGDYVRAATLATRFLAEAAGDEAMTQAIETILERGADSLAQQFVFAMRRHSAKSVLKAAISQEHSGPFGLAA